MPKYHYKDASMFTTKSKEQRCLHGLFCLAYDRNNKKKEVVLSFPILHGLFVSVPNELEYSAFVQFIIYGCRKKSIR